MVSQATVGLNATTCAFSVIAAVFFGVGCIAYNNDGDTIESTNWFFTHDGPGDTFVGLHNVYFKSNGTSSVGAGGNSTSSGGTHIVRTFDNGTVCRRNGDGAFSMMVIATTFAVLAALLSGVMICVPSKALQATGLGFTFSSFATSIVGVGLFMGNCYVQYNQDTDLDWHWGTGSVLSTVGMLLMFINTLLMIGATCTAGGERIPYENAPGASPGARPTHTTNPSSTTANAV